MAQVKFLFGTLDQYKALASKDANSLYFITDTYEIYKGEQVYTRSYEVAANPAAVISPKANYVYMFTDEKYLAEYKDNAWVELTARVANDLSNDNALPLTKAVRTAIEAVQAVIEEQAAAVTKNAEDLAKIQPVLDELTGDSEKSIEKIAEAAAADAVAKMLANADDNYNTLEEIAAYIAADATNSAKIVTDIEELKAEVGLGETSSGSSLSERIEQLESTVGTAEGEGSLVGRIEELEEQMEGIVAEGGEANRINTIKVAGEALTIGDDKSVNIAIAVNAEKPGHITINGQDYAVADLGGYVLSSTYTEGISTINNAIITVQNTFNNSIDTLRQEMTSADSALSSRIDAIDGVSWNSIT